MTPGKLLNLSEPLFSHLSNGITRVPTSEGASFIQQLLKWSASCLQDHRTPDVPEYSFGCFGCLVKIQHENHTWFAPQSRAPRRPHDDLGEPFPLLSVCCSDKGRVTANLRGASVSRKEVPADHGLEHRARGCPVPSACRSTGRAETLQSLTSRCK